VQVPLAACKPPKSQARTVDFYSVPYAPGRETSLCNDASAEHRTQNTEHLSSLGLKVRFFQPRDENPRKVGLCVFVVAVFRNHLRKTADQILLCRLAHAVDTRFGFFLFGVSPVSICDLVIRFSLQFPASRGVHPLAIGEPVRMICPALYVTER